MKICFLIFLLLHSAIYILSSPSLRYFLNAADLMVEEFINHSRRVFSRAFVVYNVHSLRHLVSECVEHGILDDFSAIKYENYLGIMKRLLRSGYMTLQQLYNRDTERNGLLTTEKIILDDDTIELSDTHIRQGGEILAGAQYRKLKFGKVILALNDADRCFMTSENVIVLLSNIVQPDERHVVLVGRKFISKENVYEYPIHSSLIGIFQVSNLSNERQFWDIQQLSRKCYLIPDTNNSFISIPLTHFWRH